MHMVCKNNNLKKVTILRNNESIHFIETRHSNFKVKMGFLVIITN